MAAELDRRGLVVAREADLVDLADLATAAGWRVCASPLVAPFPHVM
jgi:UDP-N-acetylglucosamine--N-acetylmuramyl-(pentapeptide) pyrophosphoryl-undecaprenol N-acetylglucosamine transferase